jgi:hypothetical protein
MSAGVEYRFLCSNNEKNQNIASLEKNWAKNGKFYQADTIDLYKSQIQNHFVAKA